VAAPTHYADFLRKRMLAAQDGAWGRKWVAIVGGLVDTVVAGAKQAAKSRFVADCPDDALAYHARDRMIDTIDGETYQQLRTRLLATWDTWAGMGPSLGLMVYLRDVLSLPGLYLYSVQGPAVLGGWLAGSVGGGTDDANADNWSRHAIVIGDPHPWEQPIVGPDLEVGPGLMVGITMTESELSRIRRVYRQKRGAHMVGIDLFVQFDATAPSAIRAQHDITAAMVRIPLHRAMVGYPNHGMTIGPSLVVGQEFT